MHMASWGKDCAPSKAVWWAAADGCECWWCSFNWWATPGALGCAAVGLGSLLPAQPPCCLQPVLLCAPAAWPQLHPDKWQQQQLTKKPCQQLLLIKPLGRPSWREVTWHVNDRGHWAKVSSFPGVDRAQLIWWGVKWLSRRFLYAVTVWDAFKALVCSGIHFVSDLLPWSIQPDGGSVKNRWDRMHLPCSCRHTSAAVRWNSSIWYPDLIAAMVAADANLLA